MTDTRSDTVSVVDRTRPLAAGGAVVAAHFLGHTAVFVLGEEAMVFTAPTASCGGSPSMTARSSPRRPTASASSAAATTAA